MKFIIAIFCSSLSLLASANVYALTCPSIKSITWQGTKWQAPKGWQLIVVGKSNKIAKFDHASWLPHKMQGLFSCNYKLAGKGYLHLSYHQSQPLPSGKDWYPHQQKFPVVHPSGYTCYAKQSTECKI